MSTTPGCMECPSRARGVLSGLSEENLQLLEPGRTSHLYEAGQALFYEGTPALVVHCIREGHVKMWRSGANGEPQVMGTRGPGYLVGLRPVLAEKEYNSTAESLVRSAVCSFPGNLFVRALREHADFAYALFRRIAEISIDFENDLVSASLATVRQRLAAFLERHALPELGNTVKLRGSRAQPSSLTREELALLVGTSPETLSRTLHALADELVLELNGREIRVLDRELLGRIARAPAGGPDPS